MRTLATTHDAPGQAPDDLVRAVLDARHWSHRELGRRAGVDEKTSRIWARDEVPDRYRPLLRAFLDQAGDDFTSDRLARLLGRYEWSHRELASRLDVERSTITHWLAGGRIPPAIQDQLRTLEAAAPNELLAWRRRVGLTRDQVARLFYVSVGRIGQWERGASIPDVHRSRFDQLRHEVPASAGHALKARRLAKGLSLAQLARLVDVPKSRIVQWENGDREVPAKYRGALERALTVRARPREYDCAVLELLGRAPGLSADEVVAHIAPEHAGAVLGSLQRLVAARQAERVAVRGEDMPGRPKPIARFYLPDQAVAAERAPREFSGAELRRQRIAKGYTQASFARALEPPVSREAVRAWEQALIVPAMRRREILVALSHPAPRAESTTPPSALPDLRDRRRRAGLTQAELASRLGLSNGQAQVSAWERQEAPLGAKRASQIVSVLEAAAGEPPAPTARQLCDARARLHLSRGQVAVATGVSRGTVLRWERGAPIRRRFWQAVRAIIDAPAGSAAPAGPEVMADLRARRVSLRLTQRKLAGAAGVWQGDISRWERGAVVPPAARERVERELATLATGVSRPDPRREDVLALVKREPGLTAKAILKRRVGGNWSTLRRTLAALVAAGDVHERPTAYVDSAGRDRWRTGIYPGRALTPQATPASLSGDDIVALRTGVNWSQAELSRQLGLSQTTVWRWEHDVSEPTGEMAKTIRRVVSQARPAAAA